jgi:hypothetical protein
MHFCWRAYNDIIDHRSSLSIGQICVQDEEDDLFRRDFGQATLEDHFDKTVLPKVMQVKDFGRAGRTKYTHLVDQDTTEVSHGWKMLLTPTKAIICSQNCCFCTRIIKITVIVLVLY